MTIKNLIQKKDYDYISIRYTPPKKWYPDKDFAKLSPKELMEISEFMGCAESRNGKLHALDGDLYDEDEEVLAFEEFVNKEKEINAGLCVVLHGDYI